MSKANMGRPVTNKHKVPAKQWRRWSNQARKVFNTMMKTMRPKLQHAFLHPKATPMSRLHWQTVQWNVSWEAACAVNGDGYLQGAVDVKRRK